MLLPELLARYNLASRKAIYDRLKALNIVLPKQNRKSYATTPIIDQLDRLDVHLKKGGSLADFDNAVEVPYREIIPNSDSSDLVPAASTELTLATTDKPEIIYRSQPENDPLRPNRLLKDAADNGYILNSNQVKEIIGVQPKGTKASQGLEFSRFGFSFYKFGRDGKQNTWIIKPILNDF